jgi:hypothetical protein
MNTARASSLLLLTCAVSAAPLQMAFTQTASSPTHRQPPPALAPSYGKLPLSFEANQGQTDPQVKFLSRGKGYSLFLTFSRR